MIKREGEERRGREMLGWGKTGNKDEEGCRGSEIEVTDEG